MDHKILVKSRLQAGRRLLEQLDCDGFEVTVALWVLRAEDRDWSLYIATPVIEQAGLLVAYRRLVESHHTLRGIPLSSAEIKLVEATSSIAQDALKIRDYSPRQTIVSLRTSQVGDLRTEKIYLYNRPIESHVVQPPKPGSSVLFDLLDALAQSFGPTGPLSIQMDDGTEFDGLLTSLHVEPNRNAYAQFIRAGEAIPQIININQIRSFKPTVAQP